jgi:hypothetical protein
MNYTIISNIPMKDPSVSAEALGVLVYLYSQPDDWRVSHQDMMRRFRIGRLPNRTPLALARARPSEVRVMISERKPIEADARARGLASANSCAEWLGSGHDCFAHSGPTTNTKKPATINAKNRHPSDHCFRMTNFDPALKPLWRGT